MLISFSRINRIIGSIGLLLLTACQHPSEECLSIAFTGDVLLDRGVRQQIQRGGVEDLFASVAPLFHQMDATVINLECPVTSVRSPLHKKYIFHAEPRWMEELVKAGISHAALANNHTMDQGRSGLTDTYQHLLSAGITPIGYGNTSSESCQPVVIKKGKIKVALFNSVTLPLENWVYLENDPGICQQTTEEIEEEIKNFKQENPESYVVVILHWGIEYQSSPTMNQRKEHTDSFVQVRMLSSDIIRTSFRKRNISMVSPSFIVWATLYSTNENRKHHKARLCNSILHLRHAKLKRIP